ncbi:hypothetical protein CKO_01419 [Citrobacter koseri ATCC BAA-895]|uniref:Uncharacterized protein n=1 Tax=Citrobacter koseri (strain ATCC BAA-895 / CDC 4225-83 / SGSC4696) TaxID=290338 RepID=A8AGE1_CITK8|nr:hypothetical protein CKO_01419 [Citrobacter koseri ATCC BAA-895]
MLLTARTSPRICWAPTPQRSYAMPNVPSWWFAKRISPHAVAGFHIHFSTLHALTCNLRYNGYKCADILLANPYHTRHSFYIRFLLPVFPA